MSFREIDHSRISPWVQGMCCLFLILALWSNFSYLGIIGEMPEEGDVILRLLGIYQNWDMFAHVGPPSNAVYPVVVGQLENDRKVNLFRGGPLSYSAPIRTRGVSRFGSSATQLFRTYRWRIFFVQLSKNPNDFVRSMYGLYLCKRWNRDRSGPESLRELRLLDVVRRRSYEGRPGDPEVHVLLDMKCPEAGPSLKNRGFSLPEW